MPSTEPVLYTIQGGVGFMIHYVENDGTSKTASGEYHTRAVKSLPECRLTGR